LNRDQKAAVIDEVAALISESEAVYAVDYRGISVPQAAELRTKLRDGDATFRVVKNTLGERAAEKAGAEGLKELLEGPTAMTFVRGDAAAAAKALRDFRRSTGGTLLEFKGGWMNGAGLSPAEIDSIAQLPSREVLEARLVGMVAAPLTGVVTALNNLIAGFARQLQQIADQGLVGGSAPAPAPAEEAAPAAEAPAAEEAAPAAEETPAAEAAPEPDAAPAEDTSSTENQED
jgi:large subunit ribosomal protein L10